MKEVIKFITVLILCIICFSCSSDDMGSSTIEFSPQQLNGTWKISFFSDENIVRTSEFSSYQFDFNINTKDIIISSNGSTSLGSFDVFQETRSGETLWIVDAEIDNRNNPGNADLQDLDEDWIIRSVNENATVIEFEELESNNKPEILHLEKVENFE